MPDFLERMKELTTSATYDGMYGRDWEKIHWKADEILVEIARAHGYTELADLYDAMEKWYA